jgi:hypothetical protein
LPGNYVVVYVKLISVFAASKMKECAAVFMVGTKNTYKLSVVWQYGTVVYAGCGGCWVPVDNWVFTVTPHGPVEAFRPFFPWNVGQCRPDNCFTHNS